MTQQIGTNRLNFTMVAAYQNVMANATAEVTHPNLAYSVMLTTGDGAEQANRAWEASGTLASGASLTLALHDLAGVDIGAGAGRDGLGQLWAIDDIVAVVILNENDADAAGTLAVEPAVANGWDAIGDHTGNGALAGQGMLAKVQLAEGGLAVASDNSGITLTASGGDVEYAVHILARASEASSSSSSSSSGSSSSSSSSSGAE
jgi:hypothetical protein